MSTPNIYAAVLRAARPALRESAMHLDVGAGRGELIAAIARQHAVRSHACDFHIERIAADVPCEQLNFDAQPLPYPDGSFELVTCSEVVEHLENYRALVREMFRVARGQSVLVVTTPNVLNLLSRVRYFVSGFANLFGPLPVRNDKLYSTGGHITPIPFFYLAHALLDAGFRDIRVDIDKAQKSSTALACLLWPFVALGWLRFMHRERARYRTLTQENRPLVEAHFHWRLLVGRTIVVTARKP